MNTSRMTLNTILQTDPTRTLTLRKRFVSQMNKRFRALKGDINETLITNDALGLNPTTPIALQINQAAPVGAFNFPTDVKKIEAFMEWLQQAQDEHILELIEQPVLVPFGAEGVPWTNTFIQSAYQKGLRRGRTELRNAGMDIPSFDDSFGSMSAALNGPIHAERLAMAYLRTFSELQGITAAMDQQISRVLAEGLADGSSAETIARNINDRMDKIGRARARTLARTEVIRAHHKATIGEYRAAGILEISVKAEWATAGFNVCPDCASLQGRIFTIAEIENKIPLHPNCRCIALPVTVDTNPEAFGPNAVGRIAPFDGSSIGQQYERADGTLVRQGFIERQEGRRIPSRARRRVRR